MMMPWTSFMFGGWWMLLFWLLVIAGGWLVVRALSDRRADSGHAGSTALDILEERYARGELSEQEFRRMREQLRR